ncbi:MAG TPA: L-histidine N(alpha)-methyltransferase [Gemmatimonadales bacterium]|nr:L-histidine N(alpha)-methyltransferase [Gemmatimonadales bacterium]
MKAHLPAAGTPERTEVSILAEVRAGLSARHKRLPSKYFYDQRGSELFEAITRLPEYYLTRAEREILAGWMPELMPALRPRGLVELGAGSGAKTRVLLDAMRATGALEAYLPIDVSGTFLQETAERLRAEYPGLVVRPVVADIEVELELPRALPAPALFALLGSTIGNFTTPQAVKLLRRVHAAMRPGDWFLLGADLRKDPAVLRAAYNDAAGLTAEFNRNILHVLNAQLGADFAPARFRHRAFYNRTAHRIEMHLVAEGAQTVTIPGMGLVHFADGETIRTEISCKYDRAAIEDLFYDAGLKLEAWRTDAEGRFAVALASRL